MGFLQEWLRKGFESLHERRPGMVAGIPSLNVML